MKQHTNYLKSSNARGQAMTEFSIAAASVLVPLFLILPILTKYIDVSLTSVEMARYVAWERSVWNDTGSDNLPAGVDLNVNVPVKESSVIGDEAKVRFMSKDEAIESTPGKLLAQENIKPYWIAKINAASNQPDYLVKVDNVKLNVEKLKETPGIGYEVLRIFAAILKPIYSMFEWLGSTNSRFDPNLDGYYSNDNGAIVSIGVQPAPHVVPADYRNDTNIKSLANTSLTFVADSALLVDTWSAQGAQMFKTQTGGLVPSSFLNNKYLNEMRNILAFVEPKLKQPDPGKSDGWDMGGFNTEPFNLHSTQSTIMLCEPTGVCSYGAGYCSNSDYSDEASCQQAGAEWMIPW